MRSLQLIAQQMTLHPHKVWKEYLLVISRILHLSHIYLKGIQGLWIRDWYGSYCDELKNFGGT
jgi:hypothetical protein